MCMSPTVVWMVAVLARGEGPVRVMSEADATVCSSRVGRSLNTSRSPDFWSLVVEVVSKFHP